MAKPSLFISYARADDEAFVKRLHGALTEAGYDVWWDRESMQARGMTFLQEIRDAITGVDRVILVVGPEIHKSAYVRAEWEYALSICKVVNPILRLGDYALVPDALKNVHTVDCRTQREFETAFEEITRILDEPSGKLGALRAVPLLPPWYIRREEDLRDVIKLVCADTTGPVVVTSKKQTVTLQGTGGIGKTTLAAALAHDCDIRRTFPDGIFWIEIGKPEPGKEPPITLRQGDVGAAFNDNREAYPDVLRGKSRLGEILADKRALLILDDVWSREHAEAFRVSAPRCRLLITTRQQGLTTQLGAVNHGLDMLTDDEGVALIEARLEIEGKDNLQRDVHRKIVHFLGGHTLAVSIAAAQLAERGADFAPRLLERLQKRQGGVNPFDDLKMEIADRQYNLEATLALSYEALSDDYQRRFRALGVFAAEGSFDEGAAATVWGDAPDNREAAEDALHFLWRGSLISRDGKGRYSQHSLLRMYALALLQRAGEVEQYRERHFAHYDALHGDFEANDNEERHPLIWHDISNILYTLEWGLRVVPQRAVDLVKALAYFLGIQNLTDLRRDLLKAALESSTRIGYVLGRANMLYALGDLFKGLDELAAAREHYDQALVLYKQIDSEIGQANTLRRMGDVFVRLDDLDAAREHYDHALVFYERLDAKIGQANTLRRMGDVFVRLDDLDAAREHYDHAVLIFAQTPQRLGQANALKALGDLFMRRGESSKARDYYDHALSIYEQIGAFIGQATVLKTQGDVFVQLGDLDAAREHYERALLIWERISDAKGQANTLKALGDLFAHLDRVEHARTAYRRALELYTVVRGNFGQVHVLGSMATLEVKQGNTDLACDYFQQLFVIVDAAKGYANHPDVKEWQRKYHELCGESDV